MLYEVITQLVPDILAVPCAGDAVCVVIDGDMALVRTGPYSYNFV